MSVYTAAIADIDQRIGRLQAARAVLVDLDSAGGNDVVVRQIARHAKPKGTDAIVLEVLDSGAATLDALVKECKVRKPVLRASLKNLIAAGRVTTVPKSWPRRYARG